MTITIDELRILFEKVIEKLQQDDIDTISSIEKLDYYWTIPTSQWTKLDADAKPVLGSLVDDWECLQEVISSDNILSIVDLERIAAILKAMSILS